MSLLTINKIDSKDLGGGALRHLFDQFVAELAAVLPRRGSKSFPRTQVARQLWGSLYSCTRQPGSNDTHTTFLLPSKGGKRLIPLSQVGQYVV